MSSITGKRLKELRKEKKKTQAEVAALFGMTEGAYRYYESGAGSLDAEKIAKLADFFDVSVDYLLGRSNLREPLTTIAAHTDDPEGIPPEAQEEIFEFIEFVKHKYGIGKKDKG
jgi:transcriptional regulator with XRE-family HTH domain